jgi:GTP-binding protein
MEILAKVSGMYRRSVSLSTRNSIRTHGRFVSSVPSASPCLSCNSYRSSSRFVSSSPSCAPRTSLLRSHSKRFSSTLSSEFASDESIASPDGPLYPSKKKQRNVAVIAHVDHGKTSLVDCLLKFSKEDGVTGSMDSNPLERERGITILAKCTSFRHNDILYNIVDTPGHADFSGEVERILNMVDGVMLVVDALDGPMPQTRYVLSKALQKGLKPVVVLNKCDRPHTRIGTVENEIFDLFVNLNANDDQLDFPIVYTSAREAWSCADVNSRTPESNMAHLLDVIADVIPAPRILGDSKQPFRMLVNQMEHDQYLGKLVLGRVSSGSIKAGDAIVALDRTGKKLEEGKAMKLFTRRGNMQVPLEAASGGDIIMISGLSSPIPTCTVSSPAAIKPLFCDPLDPPTLSMYFGVNDSPLGGREGTSLTANVIHERIRKEVETNIALSVEQAPNLPGLADAVEVRGRGELQMAILIENMRREGFELSVSPPSVLFQKDAEGNKTEPYELVIVDIDDTLSGMVIERMAQRNAKLDEYTNLGPGKSRLSFRAPSRGLIGFQSELKTESRGTATIHRVFDTYGPYVKDLDRKPKAAMVSNSPGQITAYALDSLQARGQLFVKPGDQTYIGHIVGECSRESNYDLDVNPVRAKKLTNMRASGTDEAVRLPPPKIFSLEEAIVYVSPDELVEITPSSIRLRKRILDQNTREKLSRELAKQFRT